MFIGGIVTEVNTKLLCFEIDNTTQVQMGLVCLSQPSQKFPRNRTTVRIGFTLFSSEANTIKSIVLTPDSLLEGEFSVDCNISENEFVQIITSLNLQSYDLLRITDNYIGVLKNFPLLRELSEDELLLSFIQKIAKNCHCGLPKFKLKFLNQLNYIDTKNLDRYKDFSYWTFGSHWSRPNEYLIGYLFIFGRTTTIYLTDYKQQMPCIITNVLPNKISQYLQCYVAITDYAVITEIYSYQNIQHVACILVDFNKITVLSNNNKNEEPAAVGGYETNICTIISKSMPLATLTGIEFWLHVVFEKNAKETYLCMKNSYSALLPGYSYDFYSKDKPKKVCRKEISHINPQAYQFELPPSAIFVPKESKSCNILTISEAIKHLSTGTKSVSFQGKLAQKKFINPLSSRTRKIASASFFGTPGYKTHLLEFRGESDEVLTLYLNNWENTLIPYGLIPNMRMIVYNVTPQKGKYYKSNIMTCFEIVDYDQEARFDSVDWSNSSWGTPCLLGANRVVPCGTIIWARNVSFFILGLKIYCTDDHKLEPTFTLVTMDELGESKVFAKKKYGLMLLKLLLSSQEEDFQTWCTMISSLGYYAYSKGMTCEPETEDVDQNEATRRKLTQRFNILNLIRIRLDLMCRKIDEEPSGKPVYFLLNARG